MKQMLSSDKSIAMKYCILLINNNLGRNLLSELQMSEGQQRHT